jgi:hypothetical protein
MKKHWTTILSLMVALIAVFSTTAQAGPPFLTDDPEPVEYQHGEFYVFSLLEATKGVTAVQVPAFEFNYGIAEETQFHIIAPFNSFASTGNPTEYGFGDIQLGIKYRFLKETDDWPQLGVFPMLMVPSGDADRGLGNGSVWATLPIWAQKSWGKWTTYGGIGYAINPAAGRKNYLFGGWLLQRKVTEKLTLGGEVYFQGADTDTGLGPSLSTAGGIFQSTSLINLGGFYDFDEHFHFLFSAGYSLAGDKIVPGYLGLQYTW